MEKSLCTVDILFYIASSEDGVVSAIDLAFYICDNAEARIQYLVDQALIEQADIVQVGEWSFNQIVEFVPTSYRLTVRGMDYLAGEQQRQDKMAQDIADSQAEQQRMMMERTADIRRDYILFVLGLVFGWLLGVVTPLDVWHWIKSVIQ